MEPKKLTLAMAFNNIVSVCRSVKLDANENEVIMESLRMIKAAVEPKLTPVAKPKKKGKK